MNYLIYTYSLFLIIFISIYYRKSYIITKNKIINNKMISRNDYTKDYIAPVLFVLFPMIAYSFIGIFDRIQMSEYSIYEMIIFELANIIGLIFFVLGYGYDTSIVKIPKRIKKDRTYITNKDLCIISVFIIVVIWKFDYFVDLIMNFGTGVLYHDYSIRGERNALTGIISATNSYFNLLILLLPFYRCCKNKKLSLFDAFLFIIVFSRSFFSGDRTNVLLAGILILVIINKFYFHISLKDILSYGIIGGIFLILLGHLRMYNNPTAMIEMILNNDLETLFSLKSSGEFFYTTGTMLNYIHSINIDNRFFDLGYIYVIDFLIFIPTFIFESRPLPPAEQYMLEFFPFAKAGTGHAWYILNDGYISFGLFGVAVEMYIYGKCIKKIYKRYFENNDDPIRIYAYIFLLLALFYSIRSSMFLTLKNYIISIIPLIILHFMMKTKIKY